VSRLRFARDAAGTWSQEIAPPGEMAFEVVDLSALSADGFGAAVEAHAAGVQAGLDLTRGPIARVLLPERIASGTHACWTPRDVSRPSRLMRKKDEVT
jgi:hypothetical protein